MTNVPWAALPVELAGLLRPHLAEVVAEIIATLPREVPDYARPIEGAFGEGLRLGVEVAMGRFLDLPGTSEPALSAQDRRVYLALGRGELRQGRELQTLLAAYRVGARVAFRRFATRALAAGLDPDALVSLAESTFAYIDELSATSVEGYAQEQSLRAGEADRRRAELLAVLLAGGADPAAVVAAGRLAGWVVPDSVSLVLVAHDHADGLELALGPDALVGLDGEAVLAVVPGAPAGPERVRLDRRLHGRRAVVGPPGGVAALPLYLELTRFAAGLVETGVLAGDPLHVEDHLAALLIHRDPALVAVLSDRRLAPLAALRDTTRLRLAETLLSWLQHRGERQRIAAELHVHPQTVGYRLGQLRELFGDQLEDPQSRFELEIALRSGVLAGG